MRKLNSSNAETESRTARRKNDATDQPKSVLEAFEHIVVLARNSCLGEEFFAQAAAHISYASSKLKLTPMQTVMLALFVDRSEEHEIYMSKIASYIGCSSTRILRLSKEIDALEEAHYLIASRARNRLSYRVPFDVLNALKKDEPYVFAPYPVTDVSSFFDSFNELAEQKGDDELTYEGLLKHMKEAFEAIKTTHFARTMRGLDLDDDDLALFVFMAHLFVEDNDDLIMFSDIRKLYDDQKLPHWAKRGLETGSSDLFGTKLIENVCQDGFARSDTFKLTDYAKTDVLQELRLTNTMRKSNNDLIKHDTLAKKELIYNAEERRQVDELAAILAKDRFAEVQQRLEKAGMRKGFCCLFYGAPGTGKTETVYQLARLTGRDILRVDVDKIKSCWVGESEKNMKKLFDRYRDICHEQPLAPILLFNEADAVLGVRMEGASRAVDKMENSLQNIILQEMESIDGIMIATTNLTTNLDKAFERRFLYKIRFEKPTVEARTQIWQAMLSGLTDNDAAILAREADLSGGEIENIVRRHSVNAILTGTDAINLDELLKLCNTERLQTQAFRVGF